MQTSFTVVNCQPLWQNEQTQSVDWWIGRFRIKTIYEYVRNTEHMSCYLSLYENIKFQVFAFFFVIMDLITISFFSPISFFPLHKQQKKGIMYSIRRVLTTPHFCGFNTEANGGERLGPRADFLANFDRKNSAASSWWAWTVEFFSN